jgi:Mlc titration factor MtfA (ptsG expression regulator)
MIFKLVRSLQQRYILRKYPIPDVLWQSVIPRLSVVAYLSVDELQRLKRITTLFLYEKTFSAARGFELDDEKRLIIAVQACLPILNLDLSYYDGWIEIIVYPDAFVVNRNVTDDLGLVHEQNSALSGEAWSHGPVILSWQDIQLDSFQFRQGHNVIIHEFSHKLDMLNGRANGMPPLHPGMHRQDWTDSLSMAFQYLQQQLQNENHGYINEYAATNPAEFFAVISEYFFTAPEIMQECCDDVYQQLVLFYRQDLLSQSGRGKAE